MMGSHDMIDLAEETQKAICAAADRFRMAVLNIRLKQLKRRLQFSNSACLFVVPTTVPGVFVGTVKQYKPVSEMPKAEGIAVSDAVQVASELERLAESLPEMWRAAAPVCYREPSAEVIESDGKADASVVHEPSWLARQPLIAKFVRNWPGWFG